MHDDEVEGFFYASTNMTWLDTFVNLLWYPFIKKAGW